MSARRSTPPRRRRVAGTLVMAVALTATGCARAQDVSTVTPQGRDAVLANLPTPTIGAARPNVTVVEFFDYNCPFCRREQPLLTALIKADPKVRLVYKEWPVLGPVSVDASRMVLAANWQGEYLAAHDALIASPGRLASAEQVATVLKGAGVDMKRLDADAHAHAGEINAILSRDNDEAEKLGLQGTPGLMVGRYLVFGGLDAKTLKALVAFARAHP